MQHTTKILTWCILVAPICIWLSTVVDADERYTTQPGDTLWEIAGRYVQDHTITTYQMMVALFEANPSAFIDDDINRLKTGYPLHIPTPEALLVNPTPPVTEQERDTAVVSELPISEAETATMMEAVDASIIVAQDVAKLGRELALTQEQATRQHAENEILRARIAALEARVIKLDEMASAPVTLPSRPPPTKGVWLTAPNIITASALVVLGLAVIWFWGRRMTANTTVTETKANVPEQPHIEPELSTTEGADPDPLALGLGDLDIEVEESDTACDLSADSPMARVETAGETDATLAALMIDLDDLILEPDQGVENRSEGANAASIASKAESSNAS